MTQGPFPAPHFYLPYLSQLTLQKGMIPSFTLVVIGAAIAKQVQATATTRTKVLTARFMAFSLHAGPLGAETLSGSNYISTVKPVDLGIRCGTRKLRWGAESKENRLCALGFRESTVDHVLKHRDQRLRLSVRLHVQQGFVPALRNQNRNSGFAPV